MPRLVNVLAHKCLMLAYGEDVHRVTVAHVTLAAHDTHGIVLPQPWWRRWGAFLTRPRAATTAACKTVRWALAVGVQHECD